MYLMTYLDSSEKLKKLAAACLTRSAPPQRLPARATVDVAAGQEPGLCARPAYNVHIYHICLLLVAAAYNN